MPLISVVVPVYNGEKTIQETIASVLNQTFTDLELLVINDGSQDSTLEIVSNIKDPRINVFSYPNAGLSATRNRGISRASGEYISFIDADDLWTPDKLEAQFKALQENPLAAVAYSWTNYIDKSGEFLRKGSYISVSGDVYAKLLLVNFVENGSNVLIRAEALAKVGGFDESLTSAEDRNMWLRLAVRYHFVAVPSPQILYRVSGNSMSSNLLRMEAENMLVLDRAFAQAPESIQYLKPYCQANIYKYLTYKALEEPFLRQRRFVAFRFLWNAITKDPALVPEMRNVFKLLIKIAIVALLPSKKAEALIHQSNTLSQIDHVLLDCTRTELS